MSICNDTIKTKKFKQFTYSDRLKLEALLKIKKTKKAEIAILLKKTVRSINREIKKGLMKLKKDYLLKNKIFKTDKCKGKLGFRIKKEVFVTGIYLVEGRVTPKYKGYFVSFWKKNNGVNAPYHTNDVDIIYVRTINGLIKLEKDYLLKNKILKTDKCKGKLGFRIKEDDIIYVRETGQINNFIL